MQKKAVSIYVQQQGLVHWKAEGSHTPSTVSPVKMSDRSHSK